MGMGPIRANTTVLSTHKPNSGPSYPCVPFAVAARPRFPSALASRAASLLLQRGQGVLVSRVCSVTAAPQLPAGPPHAGASLWASPAPRSACAPLLASGSEVCPESPWIYVTPGTKRPFCGSQCSGGCEETFPALRPAPSFGAAGGAGEPESK